MKQIFAVFKKEIIDHLRDRRSVFNNLGLLALMGPLIFGPIFYSLQAQLNKSEVLTLPVIGAERAPALMSFLKSHEVKIETAPDDYEEKIREGKLDVVLSIPKEFAGHFSKSEVADVELIMDDTQKNSQGVVSRTHHLLEGYSAQMGKLRLLARGIDPHVMTPLKINQVDLAKPQQSGSFMLQFAVGYGLLAAFVGAMALSLDMSAGERERGSLEPLLINPIAARKLLAGKWLAAAAFSMLAVIITFTGYLLSLKFFPFHTLGMAIRFGLTEFLLASLLVIPTSFLFAGVLLFTGLFAKTFKEAQVTASLLIFVVMLPSMILIFKPMTAKLDVMFIPLLSQNLLLGNLIRGDGVHFLFALISATTTFLLGMLCMLAAAKIITREKIVFGR